MNILRRRLLQAGALLALPSPAFATPAAMRMPAMAIRARRLANGLQVFSVADRDSASVAVQMWYRVGGKDDPPGRSGFAHLFEHLMFKRTRHMPAEMFDRLTEDVGGQNNAFTAEDVTAYENVVPSNHLERLLWAEAERLSNLDVDQASFDSERAVVEEEFRQRILANPYGRLFNALPAQGFEGPAYRRPVIGSIEDLQSATLADVRGFHATYYRPDNAVLIVCGGFEPVQLDAWVDRYFGPLPGPAKPVPRVVAVEPRRTQDKRVDLNGPNVPLPALALLWQGPAARSADAPALQVAAALLASGESSRLNDSLVYRAQRAQAVGFNVELHAQAGLIAAYAILASQQPPAPFEQALMRQIVRLADQPVSAAELDKVRTQLLTEALSSRQRPEGRCEAVGWALALHDDASYANRELAELQAVSAADVQRVLKRHVMQGRRVTLNYTQGPQE
jgi:zinc protease